MTNKKGIDTKLFDVRAVKRNIKKGYVNEDDKAAFVDAIEDKSENATVCDTNQADFVGEREERRRQREEARAAREGHLLDNNIKIG